MKGYPVDRIRNVSVVSHGGAGKTSFLEAVLYICGMTSRLGRVDNETSNLDYDPSEVRRKITISSKLVPCEWKGNKINFMDTPGYADFIGEVRCAMRVSDGALVLIDSVAGVEVQTEVVWEFAEEYRLPRIVLVNKMDRENANFYGALESLRKSFGSSLIPIHIPIGAESGFRGVVDLISMKAYVYEGDMGRASEVEIPDELMGRASEYREMIMDSVAEMDDSILERYLEGGEISQEELKSGLSKAVLEGRIIPVTCGSAIRLIGISNILDAIIDYIPDPVQRGEAFAFTPSQEKVSLTPSEDGPLAALVFKTVVDPYVGKMSFFRVYSGSMRSDTYVYNANKGREERIGQLFWLIGKKQEQCEVVGPGDIGVVAKLQETETGDTLCTRDNQLLIEPISFPEPVFSMAFEPKTKGDEDKLSMALMRLAEEDPTLKVRRDPEAGQTIVSGMGDIHLDVVLEKLKTKFGVDVLLELPKVPYRETIRTRAEAEHKHKKQTGGHGQYGHVFLRLEPLPRGGGYEFVDEIFGGAIPKQYIPGVEKGVKEAMQEGVLAGYPVVDVRVTLYDGSYHVVDSSELSFKIAGSQAFKKAMQAASPVLLEPIMNLEVIVPENFMGDVIGDLNGRRGRILGMESKGSLSIIKAQVPMAEILKYAIDLRSLTQGRGRFSVSFSHYEEVPDHIAQGIMERARKQAG